jgi:hypothetical protein
MEADVSLERAIQEHLALKDRNAALEERMPLAPYREHPRVDGRPDERSLTDPWQDGLWAATVAFDWGG